LLASSIPDQQKDPSLDITRVNSYIQASLIGPKGIVYESCQTMVHEGENPDWNSEKVLVYKSSDQKRGFLLDEFTNSNNILYISLFDMISSTTSSEYNRRKKVSLITDYFLGNFSIPLQTIMQNTKRQAEYKINRPLVLFGYYINTSSLLGNDLQSQNVDELNYVNPRIDTVLSIATHTEPQIEIPYESIMEYTGQREEIDIFYIGSSWLQKLKKNKVYGNRYVRLWKSDHC